MKKLFLLFISITLCFSAMAQMPEETINSDEDLRKGILANGMTYYIRHHDNPKERADFYIAHNVGALQENDDQDGLAHFLEHMAFNGTKHYPKKSMLEFLASNGVAFGTNVNAYTSKTETVYNLSNIPLMRESFVDSVLLILYDWSSFISCEPAEIEAERGVVREEWRRSDEPRGRTARASAHFEYMGSKHAHRTVLGNWEVVNNFKREQLLDFYHKWYRPDLQAIIIVGDINVEKMEEKVKKLFSTLPKAENPAQKEIYEIPYTETPVVGIVTDSEIQYITAKIYLKQPYPSWNERQLKSTVKKEYERAIFSNLLSHRFDRAGKETGKYRKVVAVNSTLGTCRNTTMLTVMPNGNDLETGAEAALTELRRIEQNGFLQEEFEQAKARYAKSKNIYSEKTVADRNADYVKMYVGNFLRNEPCMELTAQRKMNRELYDSITLEDVNSLIPEVITESEKLIIYTANEDNTSTIPSQEWTLAKVKEIRETDLPQVSSAGDKADLTAHPVAGAIKRVRDLKYHGAEEWTLSNGVKVVWMQKEGLSGAMQMSVYGYSPVGYGKQADIPGTRLLNSYLSSMGIRDADKNSVQAALVGNNINTSFQILRESTNVKATSASEDFESALRLLYLYLTEPNFTEDDYGRFLARTKESLEKPQSSRTVFEQERSEAMYANHAWTEKVTPKTCLRVDAENAREIYMRQFGNAADFTFFIVGALPAERVKPLVEQYLASIPSKGKPVKYPKSSFHRIEGKNDFLRDVDEEKVTVPKASIERFYYGKMKYTAADNMALIYLRRIMSERYMNSIREDKGGTYYVGVDAELEPQEKGRYTVTVDFETDPELKDILLYEVGRAVADLAAEGPTEKEMSETRLYLLKRNSERSPTLEKNITYWNGQLMNFYNTGIEIRSEDDATISEVKVKDVQRAALDLQQGSQFTSILIRR